MIHFTDLDRLPTYDVKGHFIGFITDLLVDPAHSSLRVQSFLIKTPRHELLEVAHEQMQSISALSAQTSVLARDIAPAQDHLGLIHVRKDVLDQQVIDVNRRKVVRVTDVEFDIQPRGQHSHLRIVAIDLGNRVPPRLIGLAWHRDRLRTGAAQAFIENAVAVCEELSRAPAAAA